MRPPPIHTMKGGHLVAAFFLTVITSSLIAWPFQLGLVTPATAIALFLALSAGAALWTWQVTGSLSPRRPVDVAYLGATYIHGPTLTAYRADLGYRDGKLVSVGIAGDPAGGTDPDVIIGERTVIKSKGITDDTGKNPEGIEEDLSPAELSSLDAAFAATSTNLPLNLRRRDLPILSAGSRFTVARLALTCLLAGVAAARPATAPDAMLWSLAAMGAVAAVLDASDGWMTRITGSASGYADRLSALIACVLPLALALLAWQTGRTGVWVIAAGLPAFLAGAPSLAVRGRGANGRALAALAMNALLAATLLPLSTVPDMPRFVAANLPLAAGIGAVSVSFGLAAHAFVIGFGGRTARNRPDSGS